MQYGLQRVITVADKAMNSAKNVTDACNNGDGWLFSQEIRGSRWVSKELQGFALDTAGWKYNEGMAFAMKPMIRKRKLSTGKTFEGKVCKRDGALEHAAKSTNAELFRVTSTILKTNGRRSRIWFKGRNASIHQVELRTSKGRGKILWVKRYSYK